MIDQKLIMALKKLGTGVVIQYLEELKDEKQKLICSLYFLEDLNFKEIAQILAMEAIEVEKKFDDAIKRICIRIVPTKVS